MAESGLHKPLSQKEVLSCPYFGHCLWPAAKRLPERWKFMWKKNVKFCRVKRSPARSSSSFSSSDDIFYPVLRREWFGARGIHMFLYIPYSMESRSDLLRVSQPSNSSWYTIVSIYDIFTLIYITVLDYSPGKWRPGLGAVRRLCRVRLDQTSKCKIGTMALRHP